MLFGFRDMHHLHVFFCYGDKIDLQRVGKITTRTSVLAPWGTGGTLLLYAALAVFWRRNNPNYVTHLICSEE